MKSIVFLLIAFFIAVGVDQLSKESAVAMLGFLVALGFTIAAGFVAIEKGLK